MAISLSLALLRSLIAKTNALQKNVKRNGIWSDEAQPPLRKKSFVSNNPTRHATIVAIGDLTAGAGKLLALQTHDRVPRQQCNWLRRKGGPACHCHHKHQTALIEKKAEMVGLRQSLAHLSSLSAFGPKRM